MRLLMTTDTIGGVWAYSGELTKGMLERGATVLLVTVGPGPSADQTEWLHGTTERWPAQFTHTQVRVPLEWMDDGAGCYRNSEAAMLALCEEFQPDLLHCNQFCYGALPAFRGGVSLPKVVVAHSDVLSWWRARYGVSMPESAWRTAYVDQVEAGLADADVVVGPSAASIADLRASFSFATETRTISNGRTTVSAALGDAALFAGKLLQAMTCGRAWDEGKNVALVERMGSVPLPIVIAGARRSDESVGLPPAAQEAVSAIREPGVARVRYTGQLSPREVEQLMRESTIYAVTSRYEPFGLAAVEAAIAGCAVVASDLPSQREVWGDAAVFFANDDADALEQLLKDLAGDPERVRAVARRSRSRALQHFPAEEMVSRYAALYAELMQRHRGLAHGPVGRGARVA